MRCLGTSNRSGRGGRVYGLLGVLSKAAWRAVVLNCRCCADSLVASPRNPPCVPPHGWDYSWAPWGAAQRHREPWQCRIMRTKRSWPSGGCGGGEGQPATWPPSCLLVAARSGRWSQAVAHQVSSSLRLDCTYDLVRMVRNTAARDVDVACAAEHQLCSSRTAWQR